MHRFLDIVRYIQMTMALNVSPVHYKYYHTPYVDQSCSRDQMIGVQDQDRVLWSEVKVRDRILLIWVLEEVQVSESSSPRP